MPKVVGYATTCPVCGEKWQEVRENKRGTLYIYCERGCGMKFSGATSRKIKANLAAGNSFIKPYYTVYPEKPAIEESQYIEKPQEKGANINGKSGEFGRIEPIRRPDREPAAVTGGQPAGNKPRNWLADWLGDDDE